MRNLAQCAIFEHVLGAVAAGATVQTSDAVQPGGAQSVTFVVDLGAVGAIADSPTITIRASDDDSTYEDIAATETAIVVGMANKLVVLEVVAPIHKYYKCEIDRGGTTNSIAIVAVIAILTPDRVQPASQHSTDTHTATSVIDS